MKNIPLEKVNRETLQEVKFWNKRMKINMKNRGQISLMTTMIIACSTIVASAIAGWSTASNKVSDIDTKVEVVVEREQNHYLEIKEKLESIDNKLDKLLK